MNTDNPTPTEQELAAFEKLVEQWNQRMWPAPPFGAPLPMEPDPAWVIPMTVDRPSPDITITITIKRPRGGYYC